jgi:hypothetical protein
MDKATVLTGSTKHEVTEELPALNYFNWILDGVPLRDYMPFIYAREYCCYKSHLERGKSMFGLDVQILTHGSEWVFHRDYEVESDGITVKVNCDNDQVVIDVSGTKHRIDNLDWDDINVMFHSMMDAHDAAKAVTA